MAARKLSRGFAVVRLLFFALLCAAPLARAHADEDRVQFCWATGQYDNTVYFAEAENREDRQTSFDQLLEISGIDHHPVQCHVSDSTSHRLARAQLFKRSG
jgi:hypothetical protein